MKSLNHDLKSKEAGKGSLGCMFAIVLAAVAIFLSVKLGPVYYYHYEFKGHLQQVVGRAGVRAVSEEAFVQELIKAAEANNIVLKKENIQISHFASQIRVNVEYTVPVNFIIFTRNFTFKAEETSISI